MQCGTLPIIWMFCCACDLLGPEECEEFHGSWNATESIQGACRLDDGETLQIGPAVATGKASVLGDGCDATLIGPSLNADDIDVPENAAAVLSFFDIDLGGDQVEATISPWLLLFRDGVEASYGDNLYRYTGTVSTDRIVLEGDGIANGTVQRDRFDCSGSGKLVLTRGSAELTCPVYTKQKHLDEPTIEEWEQLTGKVLLSGVGAYSGIEVGPPSLNWDGVLIKERVSLAAGGDTCGLGTLVAQQEEFFCSCDRLPCEAVFAVGGKFSGSPSSLANAEHNVFWDNHRIMSEMTSLLHHANEDRCEIRCNQEYSCDGTTIGRYLITYELSRDDVVGKTRVHVSKTPR